MPIDHIIIEFAAAKLDETVDFYLKAFRPLQYEKCYEDAVTTGVGPPNEPELWLFPISDRETPKYHVALKCEGKS